MSSTYITCETCKGSGHLEHFAHVDGGICYECDGSGETERKEATQMRAPKTRECSPIARLRDMYRAARSQIRDEKIISARDWASKSSGYCAADVVLSLLADISETDRQNAIQAFAALGLTLRLLRSCATVQSLRAA